MTSAATILRGATVNSWFLRPRRDYFVNESIFHGLGGADDEVTVSVLGDALDGLTGVLGEHVVQHVLHTQDLTSLDLDVRRLSPDAAPRWVQQHARVRQREALALGAGAEQHRRGRGGLTEAERRDG